MSTSCKLDEQKIRYIKNEIYRIYLKELEIMKNANNKNNFFVNVGL